MGWSLTSTSEPRWRPVWFQGAQVTAAVTACAIMEEGVWRTWIATHATAHTHHSLEPTAKQVRNFSNTFFDEGFIFGYTRLWNLFCWGYLVQRLMCQHINYGFVKSYSKCKSYVFYFRSLAKIDVSQFLMILTLDLSPFFIQWYWLEWGAVFHHSVSLI